MSKRPRFDREAEEELLAAASWYDSQRPGLGVELLEAIDDAVARVAEAPTAFTPDENAPAQLGVRRCSLRRFPYSVVFVELADEIRIVALAHKRRRPDFWRGRL
ncbi:MAG TPA: type II toxin-antitoxin system RelE/ParE family toxin [Polyangia bacterium]|nr:type II toxin-antitoxin system RelE/ParE family toxin [Polyangia bacterium]